MRSKCESYESDSGIQSKCDLSSVNCRYNSFAILPNLEISVDNIIKDSETKCSFFGTNQSGTTLIFNLLSQGYDYFCQLD